MKAIKTDRLEGKALDWATAKAVDQSVKVLDSGNQGGKHQVQHVYAGELEPWWPTIDWRQTGKLITIYKIQFKDEYPKIRAWTVIDGVLGEGVDLSYQVAACRAIVAAKFYGEVNVPEELL